ncbi:MAG: hypothetical protein ACRDRQ_17090 [Pseudonocardiaceae bacterium]
MLLSPELLGIADVAYHDFAAGNVITETFSVILHRAGDLRYVQEFPVGLEQRKATCKFFAYCQGAHAGDRYFEHNKFTATETRALPNVRTGAGVGAGGFDGRKGDRMTVPERLAITTTVDPCEPT